MKKNGLHDNIVPVIALIYIAFSFAIKIIILLGLSSASETLISTIESNDNNLLIFVFGFYFGSSVNNRMKNPPTTIENIENVDFKPESENEKSDKA